MNKFYVENVTSADKSVTIVGEDVNHIKNVLRLRNGEQIMVVGSDQKNYICSITEVNDDFVNADIVDIEENAAELSAKITLYQGMPKSDKMEWIIQKTVELGVARVVPVMMERSVVKLDAAKQRKKVSRYQGVAESAAKQSGRGFIPEIGDFMTFKEAVQEAQGLGKNKENASASLLLPYESAKGISYTREIFDQAVKTDSIAIFIGPEGGFAESEVKLAEDAGAKIVTLGHRILRTETAGMTVLSILGYLMERD